MISFDEAVKYRLANKYNDWAVPKNQSAESDKGKYTAQHRFSEKYFFVNSNPKFAISKESAVYTIGSCFARNVERALLGKGLKVPTANVAINQDHYVSKPRFGNTVLNKYNPFSMASEILRGLSEVEYENRGLIEVSAGRYYDPAASHLGLMAYEDAVAIRDELDRISRKIRDSDVFLLTLGLTESWFDRDSGIVFNQINPAQLRGIRNRLVFENATVFSAYEKMQKALVCLKKHVVNAKVVVTVSPVPLLNTFTGWDIVSANTYSKSTLRVVAQMLADEFDFVDYYPSYEMVVNSQRDFAWGEDQAHVSDNVVNEVIGQFVRRYVVE